MRKQVADGSYKKVVIKMSIPQLLKSSIHDPGFQKAAVNGCCWSRLAFCQMAMTVIGVFSTNMRTVDTIGPPLRPAVDTENQHKRLCEGANMNGIG